jgi:serine/threonine protein kinase
VYNIQTKTCKIIDFGLCKFLKEGENSFYGECGTIYYIAPEIANKEALSYDIDIWALGITFSEIILSYPLLYHDNDDCVMQMIKLYDYKLDGLYRKEFSKLNEKNRELLFRFLQPKGKRITIPEILNL